MLACKGRRSVVGVIVGCAIIAGGCSRLSPEAFDHSRFRPAGNLTLCFDLSSTNHVVAGILVNMPPPPEAKQYSVLLPFDSTLVENDKDLIVTAASYGESTWMNFVLYQGVGTGRSIGLVPRFVGGDDKDLIRGNLPGSLYLIDDGFNYRFFLRLPPHADKSAVQSVLTELSQVTVDAIAVRLPPGAQVFESEGPSAKARSEFIAGGAKIKVYPPDQTRAAAKVIDISYQVPPTAGQEKVFNFMLKLFGVLIAPIVGLVFISSKKVRAPRARKSLIAAASIVEAVILVGLLYWAFSVQNAVGLDAIFEVILAIVGAAATIAIAFVRVEE